jgi:hypothetical protein
MSVRKNPELARECPFEAFDPWQERSDQSSLLEGEIEAKKKAMK